MGGDLTMAGENQNMVLMADDDTEDCMLATEAFEASGARGVFSCVEDGMKLLDYLKQVPHSDAGRMPNLILLDLNMPRKDGREVLIEIQSEPSLEHIPIVILTTSKEEKDVIFCMQAGARSFITKPGTFDEWVEIMRSLARSWLTT
jgi:CheY-like chemotaxis protein